MTFLFLVGSIATALAASLAWKRWTKAPAPLRITLVTLVSVVSVAMLIVSLTTLTPTHSKTGSHRSTTAYPLDDIQLSSGGGVVVFTYMGDLGETTIAVRPRDVRVVVIPDVERERVDVVSAVIPPTVHYPSGSIARTLPDTTTTYVLYIHEDAR